MFIDVYVSISSNMFEVFELSIIFFLTILAQLKQYIQISKLLLFSCKFVLQITL